jgi:phosphate transport system protein
MPGMHIQRHFDRDIEEIKDLLLRMGAMVEDAIQQSIRALMERDPRVAQSVIDSDDRIDRMELDIDQRVMELIAKMQPAAVDLRFVATVMKITPELERIADLAQDVCERVLELCTEPQIERLVQLPRLAEDAESMVRRALDAFVRGDTQLAREVIKHDRAVDQLTVDSFRTLLTYMLEDPRNITPAIRLTFIGKYFERMADGATNICEMVVYLVEGTTIKHSSAPQ